ncbi:hypothetical protein ACO2Q8_22975 [Larkinella sp. VNQ87]|uniref:hypothetical protein n=1 Tax=Larkinella sp. VNQ87 TaxID=3400921 RepID=UPI003C1077F7
MKKTLTLLALCGLLTTTGFAQSTRKLVETTTQFLATLNAEELQETQYAFTDSLRLKWTNLPVGLVPRPGIA